MVFTGLIITAFIAAAGFWSSEAYFHLACPGFNSELSCPKGKVIRITNLTNGPADSVDCSAQTTPVQTKSTCLHPAMLRWSRFICDNLEYCRLPKPHPRMTMCKSSKDFFLQFVYDCVDRQKGEKSIVACEGDKLDIQCETGAIRIQKAAYGRFDQKTCTEKPSTATFCHSLTVGFMMSGCEGLKSCSLEINDDMLGNTAFCDESRKYLLLDYICK
ncbi:L-rhamnose-binding lectin CSL3-like [Antennarius striatus]|uniref:L-rhamnose-binding lectin CSL3-like n=1 Tax=Antennarius striatus TaxID=241820 RepID=UPI0035AF6A33